MNSGFEICLGLSELFKWSWNCSWSSWNMLTWAIFLPAICFIRMNRNCSLSKCLMLTNYLLPCWEFQNGLNDFCSHATKIHILKTQFPTEVSDTSENCSFNWLNCSMTQVSIKAPITIHDSLPVTLILLVKLPQHFSNEYGTTYTCEKAFSCAKWNKSKFCSRITDENLHDMMQTITSKMKQNVNSLVKQRQANISH